MTPQHMNHRQLVGRFGEDETARRYAEQGFTVVARNLHVSHNEIDLILENETHLVFVEVKTRRATPGERSRYGRPAAAIDKAKRDRMRKAAQDFVDDIMRRADEGLTANLGEVRKTRAALKQQIPSVKE